MRRSLTAALAVLSYSWSSPAAEHRFECTACVLDKFGVPLPWAWSAALCLFTPRTLFSPGAWVARSVAAGLFLPTSECAAVLNATSSGDRAESAYNCARGLSFSALAWSHLARPEWQHSFKLYGGLDDAMLLAWSSSALWWGHELATHWHRVLRPALTLPLLLALPERQVGLAYFLSVHLELICSSLSLEPAAAESQTPSGQALAVGDGIEVYRPDEQWWHRASVVASRPSGLLWRRRQYLVRDGHGLEVWEDLDMDLEGVEAGTHRAGAKAWRRQRACREANGSSSSSPCPEAELSAAEGGSLNKP